MCSISTILLRYLVLVSICGLVSCITSTLLYSYKVLFLYVQSSSTVYHKHNLVNVLGIILYVAMGLTVYHKHNLVKVLGIVLYVAMSLIVPCKGLALVRQY